MDWQDVAINWMWAVSEKEVPETAQLLNLTGLLVHSGLFQPDDSIRAQLGLSDHCLFFSSFLIHCHQSACCSGNKRGKIKPQSLWWVILSPSHFSFHFQMCLPVASSVLQGWKPPLLCQNRIINEWENSEHLRSRSCTMCQQENGNTVSWEVLSLKQLLINRFTL